MPPKKPAAPAASKVDTGAEGLPLATAVAPHPSSDLQKPTQDPLPSVQFNNEKSSSSSLQMEDNKKDKYSVIHLYTPEELQH